MNPSDVTSLLDDLLTGEGEQDVLASRLAGVLIEHLDGPALAAGVRYLRERAIQVPETESTLDIVGTGGGHFRRVGALNISTLSSLIVASSGVAVCKQGNRKATSTSGSSDLLEALGIPIGLGPEEVKECVLQTGFGYCFAPRFHPGLGKIAPIRRALGHPTLINWMAPLANPARPRYVLLGTHDVDLARLMAGTLLELDVVRATVVCGPNGLDELSVVSPSVIFEVDGHAKSVTERIIDPAAEFGIVFTSEPVGGDTDWNLKLAEQVIAGTCESPYRETLAANVALARYTRGLEATLAEAWATALPLVSAGIAPWFQATRTFHQSLVS
ncbi:anthranilate phosphoribosyltransferase [Catelliglobosispora koreensis]|uniref:anthranilate phosphoribosyltransferase n=1 Tax=Catelliglobosispora koreensis TaxID=129052 RepID=UPI000365F0BE|nr:anthranilate phosphoribosyltransferase [Catelliglobosispora koreensis]